MGTLMMLNVWGIIWRNQKIVSGYERREMLQLLVQRQGLASRTNTLFSVPMLMYMVYSAHSPGAYLAS